MDVLGQVLGQALLGSAESPQRQQVCGDVLMCVRIAMFHACGYGNACVVRVRTYGDVSCVCVRPNIS